MSNDERKERPRGPVPRPELKPGEIPPERWSIEAPTDGEWWDRPEPIYPGEPGHPATKKEPEPDEG